MYNSRSTTTLNKNTVENITVSSAFTHKKFTERENIDGNGESVTTGKWNAETGKFTLGSKLTQPGIYTGEVEVTFKGGVKEKYAVTLKKNPTDSLKYTAELKGGVIEVSGLVVENGNGSTYEPKTGVKLVKKDSQKETTLDSTSKSGTFKFSTLGVADNNELKENDVYELQVTYGKNNEYTLKSDIVLVKQAIPEIKEAYMTNNTGASGFRSSFQTSAQNFFNTGISVTASITPAANNISTYSATIGDQTILTFEQTYSGTNTKVGGAELKVTTGVSTINLIVSAVTLKSSSASNINDNFVNKVIVTYGDINGSHLTDTGLVGDYYIQTEGKSTVYFDATSGLTPAISVGADASAANNGVDYVLLYNGTTALPKTISTGGSHVIDVDFNKIGHGYESIKVEFGVDASADLSAISVVNSQIASSPVSTPAGKDNHLHTALVSSVGKSPVATLVVVTDTLDAISNQAKFMVTSQSEGKLTIVNGRNIIGMGTDLNNAKLTVGNATTNVVGTESTGNDLVFRVQFNGEVPSTFDWTLGVNNTSKSVKGTVNTGSVDAFNLVSLTTTNTETQNISDQFTVKGTYDTAAFGSTGKITVDSLGTDRVTLDQFKKGSHNIVLTNSSGKYQGTYTNGIMVSRGSFTLGLSAGSTSSTTANLKITPTALVSGAVDKINEGVIEYRESVTSGTNSNSWVKANVTFTTTGNSKEIKDKTELTKTVTGLTAGKTYDFRVTYRVKNGNTVTEEVMAEVKNVRLSGTTAGTVTGGSGSTTGSITGTGSSGSSSNTTGNAATTTIQPGSIVAGATTATATLPTGFTFDGSKTPMATGFKYKGKDGKTVVETQEQFKNVQLKFSNGKAEVVGLVPGKTYEEIAFNYTDSNGTTKTLVLKDVKTTAGSESEKYLANVYEVVFNRPADETGYHFHFKNLTDKTTALKEFLLNMLTEKEFVETYKTPETKIEALYSAIVARTSDEAGKKFWVEEYKKALTTYGTESLALQAIADRMVNETELKELANRINFKL